MLLRSNPLSFLLSRPCLALASSSHSVSLLRTPGYPTTQVACKSSQSSSARTHKHPKPKRTSKPRAPKRSMKIAVEGCCHGGLDTIYARIAELESKGGYKVDLLLVCGDFQAVRNRADMLCMSVPPKYRVLGDFCKYYSGEKRAPILTIVIGGNHEASNHLWELYHGGWLAPNIYFLGHAGCVQVNGIRIAGASGIYKRLDYGKGFWERLPYSYSSTRSIYHIREFNIRKLSLLSSPAIFLSHEWPQGIERHGDTKDLLRRKKFFAEDVKNRTLGAPPLMGLLKTIKPARWFAAHLHCRFEARVEHVDAPQQPAEGANKDDAGEGAAQQAAEIAAQPTFANPDEIMLDDEVDEVAAAAAAPPPKAPVRETRFVALDKFYDERTWTQRFIDVIDVPIPAGFREQAPAGASAPVLSFDPEWLAITRVFDRYMSLGETQQRYPDEPTARDAVRKELDWVHARVIGDKAIGRVEDCQTFAAVAPDYRARMVDAGLQPPHYRNPQTQAFCAMLEIENKIDPPVAGPAATAQLAAVRE
ncbi:hypothetical protein WOLCODRAFT_159105 [Wolfiporia cocos MD-104 SS10]|uniref:Lariat debranching enzyme C-terminal domain-containing protein n=1 Tax=Wolfiporia cocos (strain MD-104) TaxID=742152 RepID=A0A2H3JI32_WOLCO|nr:hypothetical protein WOLCODRAFT_159105 [Wolfiporia cocos MD-104 SS10]